MLTKERKAELRRESKAVPYGGETVWRTGLTAEERKYMEHIDELADLWGGDLDDECPAWRDDLSMEDQELLQEWDAAFETGLARMAEAILAMDIERGVASHGG